MNRDTLLMQVNTGSVAKYEDWQSEEKNWQKEARQAFEATNDESIEIPSILEYLLDGILVEVEWINGEIVEVR